MKRIIFFAVVLIFTGCAKTSENMAQRDIFAMDTYMNLKAYGKNAENALSTAESEILRLEALLSVTNESSDIYKVNNSFGETVELSDDTAEIIRKGLEISDETMGFLDITVYPVLKEWGFTTGSYKIPDNEKINELLENVDYRQVQLSGNSISVPKNFQLDLGALAKGYTSDKVISIMKKNGVKSAIVNLGGNVHTLGRKPDGSLWKVAVTDPFSPDSAAGILEASDKAVITSGNYERYFTGDDGKRYCHIIDPSSGYPSDNGLVSVTIIGESGILCDGLSTALFVSGKENAISYWREHSGFDMILISDEHEIFVTEDIFGSFENVSGMKTEVIYREP